MFLVDLAGFDAGWEGRSNRGRGVPRKRVWVHGGATASTTDLVSV